MRDSYVLLMSILVHEATGHLLLPMLPLGQNLTATALHGMAAPRQTQTVPYGHDCQMGNGIGIDHPVSCDDPGTCCSEGRICLHQMAWPSSGACSAQNQGSPHPRWLATKVPAEFWLEDEEAQKARNKAITAGALVFMIANKNKQLYKKIKKYMTH